MGRASRDLRFSLLAGAGAVALLAGGLGAAAQADAGRPDRSEVTLGAPVSAAPASGVPAAVATLPECVIGAEPGERHATFAGEMTALAGSVRMEIRIELEQRLEGEAQFHTVATPGVGEWRVSAPGVHTYRYLLKGTNLSAPGSYRASVHFRWLSARGSVLRRAEHLTPRCLQPAPPATSAGSGEGTGASTG